ncbi:MAG: hypothetical protein K2J00_06795 [Bacteroidaceae bacterium]|nr:hypothetical protein [Bacteroidaceae bacterium]
MQHPRLQNRISESTLTLPLCMVAGALVWFWSGNGSPDFRLSAIAALASAVLTTYIVLETASEFSLLRVQSDMIAAVWVMTVAMTSSVHTFSEGWVAAPALAAGYYIMFSTYQKHEPVVHVFHIFLLLGAASLAIPHLIVFVPLFYWYLAIFLRCMTWRCFWAGIVGFVLPVCFVMGWSIFTDDYSFPAESLDRLLSAKPFSGEDYRLMLSDGRTDALNLVFITILSAVGIVHYLRYYYKDKIRTRMYLYIYVMQTIACWLTILCLPAMFTKLAPVLLLGSCTMAAHFFAQTNTRTSNAFFCTSVLVLILLTLINMGIWTF